MTADSQARHGSSIALSAVDVLRPAPGDIVEVVEGEVLAFAVRRDGVRYLLSRRLPGQAIAGCAEAPDGASLLLVGGQGSRVQVRNLEQHLAERGEVALAEWIYALGEASLNNRWADKVIAPGDSVLRLAPGERVSATADAVPSHDHSIQGWLSIASGSARYCGIEGAEIGVLDPAVPITRGVWLTSGLRCQIANSSPPEGAQEWSRALSLVGRLALSACVQLMDTLDTARADRLLGAEERALRDAGDALDQLAGAVLGPIVRPIARTREDSSALAAAFIVAEAGQLDVDPASRARAHSEVSAGREPFAAAGEATCSLPRHIDLASEWTSKEGPALVVRQKNGDYAAAVWKGRTWVLINPADPSTSITITSEIAAGLNRRATQFLPVLPARPTNIRDLIRLGRRGSSRDFFIVALLTVLIASLSFLTPLVFGRIAGSFGEISRSELVLALATLGLLLLATVSWQFVRSLALLRARMRFLSVTIGAVWDRMLKLRAGWHEARPLGDRMVQSTAVDMAAKGLPDATIAALLDSVTILASLAAIATTTVPLLVSLIILFALQIVVNTWLVRKGVQLSRDRVEASGQANGRLLETLKAVGRLQVFGAQDRAFRRWATSHALLTKADLALRKLTVTQGIVFGIWPVIGFIVIVMVSGISGATFGEFVTAQTAATLATATIMITASSSSALLNSRAVLAEVEPILESIPEGFGEGADPGILSGGLTVKDLTFRYDPSGPAVLTNVSFSVKPGEHVAIVGPSGCGKTTLMRILLGLEEPESGVITVDGKDLSSLDRPSVRRQIGCVLQSSTLLPGPISDNIDMGRGLTHEQMWTALEQASVADDVRAMGLGMATPVVDGGSTVSGGQRQRILLARALAGTPRMLILDEATSALDNITQRTVIDFLERLRLTRIVVAHRLSTIRSADRIIVLAGGRVEQEGTYDELMATPGHFRDLAERQLT
jgi:ABC-type bacteriocin/lantibiotic exporter with double-glycine peptidase domain